MTKELKKGGFARVLIEIDTSTYPLEAVPVTTPNGTKHFALGDVPSDHLNPSSPLDPCVLEEMDTNVPCQPFPPLGDGDLDTTLDATTDPGLENEEFDKEDDKAPPKDLVPSKTSSPSDKGPNLNNVVPPLGSNTSRGKNVLKDIIAEVFQEATGGKKKKNVLKKVGGVKFIGVKVGSAPRNSKGAMGFKAVLLSPSPGRTVFAFMGLFETKLNLRNLNCFMEGRLFNWCSFSDYNLIYRAKSSYVQLFMSSIQWWNVEIFGTTSVT
nr:hypothetical protein Iba_chr03dCG0080 [Ipomoea batatas]